MSDESMHYYHGKLSREEAEDVLKNYEHAENGLFLVRKSSSSEVDYVLSVLKDNDVIHYQIFRHGEDAFFSVEEQTIIHGLETLVEYYQTDGGNGDVCQLRSFVKKEPLPPDTRRHGRTNLLHRATKEGSIVIVTELLQCGYRNLDAKDETGQTAVHLASRFGVDEKERRDKETILEKLLRAGASANCRDIDGYTPLHYACQSNFPSTVRILVEVGGANVQLRNPETGWVPLHEAASRGYAEVVLMLISLGAPIRPRTNSNLTPGLLARSNEHFECENLLSQHRSPELTNSRSNWFHGTLDRLEAQLILEQNGLTDGMYLVRFSKKSKNHVLTMCCNKQCYNFQILKQGDFWFIDDGPFLDSLEHVVEHYSKFSDGLPTFLVRPILPAVKPPVPSFPSNLNKQTPTTLPTKQRRSRDSTSSSDRNLSHVSSSTLPRRLRHSPTSPSSNILNGHLASPFPLSTPNEKKTEKDFFIPYDNIILKETLGEGEFGSVYRGIYQTKGGFEEKVAVKTLHKKYMLSNKDEFLQEAKVMMNLNHHCIVKLIGISKGESLLMVQELVPLGSMLIYLLKNATTIRPRHDLHLWASQIACGMHYLEEQRFVHRDLAARNILLASRNQAKICDFGLSRAMQGNQQNYEASQGGRWPIKWYAPESYNNGTFSSASDVWSFGVTLWEMFSFGQPPYGDMKGDEVIEFVERGDRLPKPEQCPCDVYRIMEECWSYHARNRPKFEMLASFFIPAYSNMHDLILETDIS